ncbi:radical SAM protein [Candidatus Sumerlaeota bacterium]|nr:radical SAM protein [Candidatus Sumerlaeota bacterium]
MSVAPIQHLRRAMRGFRRLQLQRDRRRASDRAQANAALNAVEIRHGRTRLRSTPVTIQVMTTLVCNLRCPFCRREEEGYRRWIDSLSADERHMPWEVVEKILAVAPHAHAISLTPLGEPTLYRHWDRFLDRAMELGLDNLEMTSNATVLPDAMCERLILAGFRAVHLSIDSTDEERFGQMRLGTTLGHVEGNLARLREWKRRLGSDRPEVQIASTLSRENIEELPALVDFAARHGASDLIVQKMEMGPECDPRDDLVHHPEITRGAIAEARRRAEGHGLNLLVHFAMTNLVTAGDGEGDASSQSVLGAHSLTDLCAHPFHYLVVDINGDARPCCWASVRFGNLAEAPDFEAVWNSELARRVRADFLAGRLTPGCIDRHCGVSQRWDQLRAGE